MIYSKKFKKNSGIIIFCPSIEEGGVEKNLYIISNYLSKKNEWALDDFYGNKLTFPFASGHPFLYFYVVVI